MMCNQTTSVIALIPEFYEEDCMSGAFSLYAPYFRTENC